MTLKKVFPLAPHAIFYEFLKSGVFAYILHSKILHFSKFQQFFFYIFKEQIACSLFLKQTPFVGTSKIYNNKKYSRKIEFLIRVLTMFSFHTWLL